MPAPEQTTAAEVARHTALVRSQFDDVVRAGGHHPVARYDPAAHRHYVRRRALLGALIGSIGLRARDVFFAANLVYFLMLLFCGVNVDVSDLPGWMEAVGTAIPLTHGIQAARQIVDGATLGDVAGLVATEAAIGAAYGVAAYGLFRLFEAEGRRRASLETY